VDSTTLNFDQRVRKDLERFQENVGLAPAADLEMILLKGHLLIEEQLQSFIEFALPNPASLAGTHLGFNQRLALAQTLHRQPSRFGYEWVWEAVKTLNTLRNQMAHNLTPAGFEAKLASFAGFVETRLPAPVVPGEGAEYRMAKFGLMISVLNLCLSRLLQSEAGHPF
jgi:hypothetical protein